MAWRSTNAPSMRRGGVVVVADAARDLARAPAAGPPVDYAEPHDAREARRQRARQDAPVERAEERRRFCRAVRPDLAEGRRWFLRRFLLPSCPLRLDWRCWL